MWEKLAQQDQQVFLLSFGFCHSSKGTRAKATCPVLAIGISVLLTEVTACYMLTNECPFPGHLGAPHSLPWFMQLDMRDQMLSQQGGMASGDDILLT